VCVFCDSHETPSKRWYYKWWQERLHSPSCTRLLGVSAVLYHVCGEDSPKSNKKLISSISALYTGPARYIGLWHMENRGSEHTDTCSESSWTTALCIFQCSGAAESYVCGEGTGHILDIWNDQSYSPSLYLTKTPYFHYVCPMAVHSVALALIQGFSWWSLRVLTTIWPSKRQAYYVAVSRA